MMGQQTNIRDHVPTLGKGTSSTQKSRLVGDKSVPSSAIRLPNGSLNDDDDDDDDDDGL